MIFPAILGLQKQSRLSRMIRTGQHALLACCLIGNTVAFAQNAGVPVGVPPSAPPPSLTATQTNNAPEQGAGIQPIPAATAPTAGSTSESAGTQSIGQKIDLLTLKDLEDKLQATPDPIFMRSSKTFQIDLLTTLEKEMTSAGSIVSVPDRKTLE